MKELYALPRMPPTSANAQPMRLTFVKSAEAKERLKPALAPMNVEKTMTAPVTAIVAHDAFFFEKLPQLLPGKGEGYAKHLASLPRAEIDAWALLNGSLQGAYLILAARALGLDCGPLGGFDKPKVDAAFFPEGRWQSSFLLNLGYGDPTKVNPRNPRLSFEEACRIA